MQSMLSPKRRAVSKILLLRIGMCSYEKQQIRINSQLLYQLSYAPAEIPRADPARSRADLATRPAAQR